jgi:hypothetical protein
LSKPDFRKQGDYQKAEAARPRLSNINGLGSTALAVVSTWLTI